MYKTDAFSDPRDSKFGNSGIQEIPGHFCAISGNSEIRPEKTSLQNTLCAVPSRDFRGKSGHFRTFSGNVKFKKMQKKQKAKNAKKSVPTLEILGVFIDRAVAIVEALKKCRK
jgi:hypothetical protein